MGFSKSSGVHGEAAIAVALPQHPVENRLICAGQTNKKQTPAECKQKLDQTNDFLPSV
jgi:hypothetical protein